MAEIRAQITYHFRFDPSQQTPGNIRLPQEIIRTVTVGEELFTEKTDTDSLHRADCAALVELMETVVREATRTAKAVSPPVPEVAAPAPAAESKSILDIEPETEELSAF